MSLLQDKWTCCASGVQVLETGLEARRWVFRGRQKASGGRDGCMFEMKHVRSHVQSKEVGGCVGCDDLGRQVQSSGNATQHQVARLRDCIIGASVMSASKACHTHPPGGHCIIMIIA